MRKKIAIIVGAGPAGLTAAYELLKTTDILPVILEAEGHIGGIARTHEHRGNRMDMGGHRFFSKSDLVMDFWKSIFPVQGAPAKDDILFGRQASIPMEPGGPDPEREDEVLLARKRVSRIYYLKKFFDYPVALNARTIRNLGFVRILKIGLSYLASSFKKRKVEKSLEDFMVNRFGLELYRTFFQDYTRKVWGVDPSAIPADWGVQRIKGLSIVSVLLHGLRSALGLKGGSLGQKGVETSLIEWFLYPKFGPGQLWEALAQKIRYMGGEILLGAKVVGILNSADRIKAVEAIDDAGRKRIFEADYLLSTMPVKDLVACMETASPEARSVAAGLMYRDFITVGLLVKKMALPGGEAAAVAPARDRGSDPATIRELVPDDWIYVQEREVELGRLQIFNNWSPYLVKDFEGTAWLGLEYFCDEGDRLWAMAPQDFISFAVSELGAIGLVDPGEVLDACQVKVPKAYPAYFGAYARFGAVKDFVDGVGNLYLIGRNGMHKYNNMDHSMLTALAAVAAIRGEGDKREVWEVNAEPEYHESRRGE